MCFCNLLVIAANNDIFECPLLRVKDTSYIVLIERHFKILLQMISNGLARFTYPIQFFLQNMAFVVAMGILTSQHMRALFFIIKAAVAM